MENKKIADIIIKQIHLFFISGLYGILLGLWYEFFRTLRKNFVHKNKMVHLEDVIFCFTAAIGLFILFQVYNIDADGVKQEIKALKDTNYPDYMVWLASGDKKDIDRIKSGF